MMGEIMEFVRPELAILVAVCWAVGLFVKKAPIAKGVGDWLIPFILLGVGVAFSALYIGAVLGEGFGLAPMVSAAIQGILVAALAVFGNQMMKQAKNGAAGE
jgi:hypothetical protein